MSLFQGTDAVASQVCFVNGEPQKDRYRKYNIKTVEGTDDYAMLYEAVSRRLKRGITDNDFPNLLLVDGGKGQLGVALAALKDANIPVGKDKLYVAGIAKARAQEGGSEVHHSPERLFIPGVKDALVLYPHTAERYLVERIRDEAHRFAITAHRSRRDKRTLNSQLNNIPGVGPSKRQALMNHFGSLKGVAQATQEQLAALPEIGDKLAQKIFNFFAT